MGTSITFEADEVHVESAGRSSVSVTAEADIKTIFENFSVADVLSHFDADDLLEEIGEDAARKFFEIE